MTKRRRRRSGGALLLLVLFAVAVTVTLTLPMFNITSVSVSGTAHTTEEEVLAAAGIPIGTNIYRVSMRKAAERISALPYVKTVEVGRRFPARVVIEVEERAERGAVVCDGGYAVIDDTCRVLRLDIEADEVTKVFGGKMEEARPGKTIVMQNARFSADFTALMEALDAAELGMDLATVYLESAADVSVETKHGLRIYLGGMEEIPYKLQLCRSILDDEHAAVTRESSGTLRWTEQGQFSYRQIEN